MECEEVEERPPDHTPDTPDTDTVGEPTSPPEPTRDKLPPGRPAASPAPPASLPSEVLPRAAGGGAGAVAAPAVLIGIGEEPPAEPAAKPVALSAPAELATAQSGPDSVPLGAALDEAPAEETPVEEAPVEQERTEWETPNSEYTTYAPMPAPAQVEELPSSAHVAVPPAAPAESERAPAEPDAPPGPAAAEDAPLEPLGVEPEGPAAESATYSAASTAAEEEVQAPATPHEASPPSVEPEMEVAPIEQPAEQIPAVPMQPTPAVFIAAAGAAQPVFPLEQVPVPAQTSMLGQAWAAPSAPWSETLPRSSLRARRSARHYFRRAAWITAIGSALLVGVVLGLVALYRWVDPPTSTLMLGQRLSGTPITQRWMPVSRISPNLHLAVIMSEDARFCRHSGVDWSALKEAVEDTADGGARGGSTISMQVVKNLFLWPSRSYVRKALELPLAYAIEAAWSKRRILEIYLNIAEWGPGVFGAEAAARHHFGKPALRLTPHEAALLAVSLPNPFEREAGSPGRGTMRLADNLLQRMRAAQGNAACVRSSLPGG